jgi:hypothetical protein
MNFFTAGEFPFFSPAPLTALPAFDLFIFIPKLFFFDIFALSFNIVFSLKYYLFLLADFSLLPISLCLFPTAYCLFPSAYFLVPIALPSAYFLFKNRYSSAA